MEKRMSCRIGSYSVNQDEPRPSLQLTDYFGFNQQQQMRDTVS